MLELARVDAYYGRSKALDQVSFAVPRGAFFCVLGRNGVGKTTLMRTLVGLMDRVDGRITLDGADIAALPVHRRSREGVGYVPQGRGVLPSFTVRENLLVGALGSRDGRPEIDDRVFELFPVLKDFLGRRGGDLSGGQQQQLAIARALLAKPKVLLLDEPTEGVQPNVVEQIEEALIELNRRGMTILLVEQNVHFARRAAERFVILERGAIAVEGPIAGLTDEVVERHMTV